MELVTQGRLVADRAADRYDSRAYLCPTVGGVVAGMWACAFYRSRGRKRNGGFASIRRGVPPISCRSA
jgi:hypothetical protein